MARYIDADLLLQRLTGVNSTVEQGIKYYNSVYNLIIEQPTADVEEVVRCEKCKYQITHTCRITGVKTLFCDYGEKPVAVEPTHF